MAHMGDLTVKVKCDTSEFDTFWDAFCEKLGVNNPMVDILLKQNAALQDERNQAVSARKAAQEDHKHWRYVNANLREELDVAREANTLLGKRIHNQRDRIAALENDNAQICKISDGQSSEIHGLGKEIERLNARVSEDAKHISILANRLAFMDVGAEGQNAVCNELRQKNGQLRSERDGLRNQVVALKGHVEAQNKNLRMHAEELDGLRDKLEVAERSIAALHSRNFGPPLNGYQERAIRIPVHVDGKRVQDVMVHISHYIQPV